MSRTITTVGFDLLEPDTTMLIGGKHGATLVFRSEERARYYASDDEWETETLVGLAEGELEIVVRGGERALRAASTGRVWVRNEVRPQTKRRIQADVFTTLDRPPPMSAEMRAVHELMKRNELDRELQRQEMKDLLDERERKVRADVEKNTAKATRAKGGNTDASGGNTAERGSDKASEVRDASGKGDPSKKVPKDLSGAKDSDAG